MSQYMNKKADPIGNAYARRNQLKTLGDLTTGKTSTPVFSSVLPSGITLPTAKETRSKKYFTSLGGFNSVYYGTGPFDEEEEVLIGDGEQLAPIEEVSVPRAHDETDEEYTTRMVSFYSTKAERLEHENELLQKQYSELRLKADGLGAQNTTLVKDASDKQIALQELDTAVQAKNRLEKENAQLRFELNEAREKLISQTNALETLSCKYANYEKLDLERIQAETKIKSLENELQQFRDQLENERATSDELRKEVDKLKAEISVKENRCTDLVAKLKDMTMTPPPTVIISSGQQEPDVTCTSDAEEDYADARPNVPVDELSLEYLMDYKKRVIVEAPIPFLPILSVEAMRRVYKERKGWMIELFDAHVDPNDYTGPFLEMIHYGQKMLQLTEAEIEKDL